MEIEGNLFSEKCSKHNLIKDTRIFHGKSETFCKICDKEKYERIASIIPIRKQHELGGS